MDTWQKCPVCNGNGTVPYGINFHTITCNVCHGHGIISIISGLPPAGPKTVIKSNVDTTNHTGNPPDISITYNNEKEVW